MSGARGRPLRAMLALAGIVACAVAADAVLELAPGPVAQETARALAEGADAGSVESALGAVFGAPEENGAADDAAMAELSSELFPLAGKEAVRASPEADVAGYVEEATAHDAFERAATALEGNGWARVDGAQGFRSSPGSQSLPGSQGAMGSFAKAEGAFSTCFVTCTEVSGKTAVVIQCVRSETTS